MTELKKLQLENEQLKEEIERQRKVLKIFEYDKESALKIQLNKIALKLRVEYQDFLSITNITDEEMTVELGNNLKCQLQNIFKILQKQNVDFK